MSRRHQVILPGQGLAYNTIKPSRKPKKNKQTKGPGLIQGQNHRENQKKQKKQRSDRHVAGHPALLNP